MPKPHTFPTLYDDALQIHIKKLKEWGYLQLGTVRASTIEWSIKGDVIGKISIYINLTADRPFIELDYKYRDEPRKYKVYLVTRQSNLGNGLMYFFVCPHTNKRCRKLYSIGGYFLHRTAFRGCMYESQIQSKSWRDMDKVYGAYFTSEKLYEQLYKKHLKKTYAGKPTKKYAKLTAEIQKSERISIDEIERLMMR